MQNFVEETAIVIDDDKNIVSLFSELLETVEIKVIGEGYDGSQAVELYKKHKPNIVFIDIMMPEYDGFYAIKKIREMDSKVKIIAVTADMQEETQKKLLELKITTIIYKPFDINEIIKSIKN